MIKKIHPIKLLVIFTMIFSLLSPSANAYAYSTPYFVTKLNDAATIGFQASQVVAKGNTVYISSFSDCYIHKVINGVQTETVAGRQGFCGYSADGSIAAQSTIQGPSSIDIGADGTVYIAEPFQHRIRAVLPDGSLTTIAGNGTSVNVSADAADARQTAFNAPAYVKVGPDGNIYTYDSGVIRRILSDGSTDHVVGDFGAAPNNNPYVEGGVASQQYFSTEQFSSNVNGASWSRFDFDPEGNLFATSGSKIYKINKSDGTIHTYYSPPVSPIDTLEDQLLPNVRFGGFTSFTIDSEGRIWSGGGSNTVGTAIQYISPTDQIVRTVAGGGTISNPPLAGPGVMPILGTDLQLLTLRSISVDNGKVFYISSYLAANGATSFYVGGLSLTQDSTAPLIQPVLSSQPDGNGWNHGPVDLSWQVTDDDSSITNTVGCDAQTITSTGVYTCTATSSGGTSSQAITITIVADSYAPTLYAPMWSQNPKSTAGTTVLNVQATDDNSGLSKAEYFVGENDPGQGNGVAMQLSNVTNGGLNADLTSTFGTEFTTGVYKISVRAQDNAGNWSSLASDYLVVYNNAGSKMTGKRTVIPSLTAGDILPGLIDNSQTDKAKFGFSVKYNSLGTIDNSSDFKFSYSTGTKCNNPTKAVNCHDMSLDATSISWLVTQGDNNSTGIFQGTATMVLDGQNSSVIYRVTGIDGERLSSTATDRFQLSVYAQGANLATDQPLWHINATDIVRGNIKISGVAIPTPPPAS